MDSPGPMRIGTLAQVSGVTTRTVRYYESLGLLPEPERRGAHRRYSAADVERLRRIEVLKELGLSLDEVAEVLSAYGEDAVAGKRRVGDVLRRQLDETDRRLASMQKFREELVFRIDLVDAYAEHTERSAK